MNAGTVNHKWMTLGEGGTAAALLALALLSIVVAANAHTPAYAFPRVSVRGGVGVGAYSRS